MTTATAAMKLFPAHSDVVLINQSSNFAKICWYRLMAKVDPFNNFISMVKSIASDTYYTGILPVYNRMTFIIHTEINNNSNTTYKIP